MRNKLCEIRERIGGECTGASEHQAKDANTVSERVTEPKRETFRDY